MEPLHDFLGDVKRRGLADGRCLGLLNVVIGREVRAADGALVSRGATWRELAAAMKQVRWDKDAVRDLGLDPAQLPPRDRLRYWYTAISQANVGSPAAAAAGDELARLLVGVGYQVRPGPSGERPVAAP